MKHLTFLVDFNEMPEPGLVLLSTTDVRSDMNGHSVHLHAGLPVVIFVDDVDETGRAGYLYATGLVELNARHDWSQHVKWCCRIDADGIRRRFELMP